MPYTEFIDITGSYADNVPLVKGGVRAYYATGSDGIAATSDQIAAAKAAGMGVILIDQSPSLSVFAAGNADVADVEPYAGTDSSADNAVAQRQARGEDSTLYVSYDNLAALQAAVTNPKDVYYWVANYAWSLQEAEAQLAAHPTWRAVQYGDPSTNPDTLVPGTSVTLLEAQADIDVGDSAWTATFLPDALPGQWHQFVSAYPAGSDVVLVGVGTDSRVYSLTKTDDTTWASAPVNIGPAIPGQWVGGVPFAVVPDGKDLQFTGEGTNGYLYDTLLTTATKTFGSPQIYSPKINSPAALPGQWRQFVSAYGSGSDVVLVGVGTDSRVYSLTKTNDATWASSPVNIGPAIPGQWAGGVPFAVVPEGNDLLFVGQGTNGYLYATLLTTATKTFGSPYVYSPKINSATAPALPGKWHQFVSCYASGSDVVLVGVGTDSRVYSLTKTDNTTWAGSPVNIGPAIPGQWVGGVPFAVVPAGDNLMFVGQGTDGYLYATLLTTATKTFGSPYVYSPKINSPPALPGQWHQFVSAYPSGADVVLVGVGTDSRVYSLTKTGNTTWASSPANIGPAIPGQWVGGVPFAVVPDGDNLQFIGQGTNGQLYATVLTTATKTFGAPYVYSPVIN
jgi:hypothetical protein